MRWRRAIVAVVVGVAVTFAMRLGSLTIVGVAQELIAGVLPQSASDAVYVYLTGGLIVSLMALPGLIVAVLIYGLGKPFGDTETRCRNCGYILRGLAVPRCPECGEGI